MRLKSFTNYGLRVLMRLLQCDATGRFGLPWSLVQSQAARLCECMKRGPELASALRPQLVIPRCSSAIGRTGSYRTRETPFWLSLKARPSLIILIHPEPL